MDQCQFQNSDDCDETEAAGVICAQKGKHFQIGINETPEKEKKNEEDNNSKFLADR